MPHRHHNLLPTPTPLHPQPHIPLPFPPHHIIQTKTKKVTKTKNVIKIKKATKTKKVTKVTARFSFASWPKRFEMSTSGSSSIGLMWPSVTTSPHVSGDNDLAKALELSMQENKLTPPLTPPRPSGSKTSAVDDDVAEGIRRSLDPNHSRALASPWASPKLREEDEWSVLFVSLLRVPTTLQAPQHI